jgi:IclR family transcriptional regulator, KDG regulon repressor
MNSDPKFSKTVNTLFRILSLFSPEKEELGVREVGKTLNLSPGSTYRLLFSMDACGFLQKNPNRKYQLGERLFEIGLLYPLHSPLRKIVRPHAEDLAKMFSTNVQVAIPRKTQVGTAIVIDRITSLDDPVFHDLPQHLSVSLYCTALGKSILSFLPPAEKKETLGKMVLKRHTKNTITQMSALRAEIDQIQKDGFSVDRGETLENLFCIGVPLFQGKKLVGALSLSDSLQRINKKNFHEVAEVLKEKAVFISRQLLGSK